MGSFADRFRPKSFTPRYPRWMVGRPLLITSSALAALGDAMFGYGQGAIAAAQLQPNFVNRFFGTNITKEDIQMDKTGVNPEVLAITVACLNISACMSSFAAAYFCDILGRRMSLRIGGFFYLIAAILQVVAPDLACLIVGRLLQGVGVGILSMTVPIIQAEIAPGNHRGFFISIEYICLNLGYALSAWVGYAFYFAFPSDISWRGPYIIEAAMAVVLVLWSFIIPETPRFLIANGFHEDGLRALADLQADGNIDDEGVRATYQEIVDVVCLENEMGQASWGQLFRQYTRRTIIGITCQVFAQFNGINAILYYLPGNLLRAGFDAPKALLYAAGSSLLYCAGTVPTMFGIDRIGRRPFLITGSFALAAALAVTGGLQFYVDSLPAGDARLPAANGIFAAVCLYLLSYGATWGPGPWLLGAEIFPMRARAKGMALSTTANWISNFIVAFITPPLFASISGGYYFILVGFCVISGIFVFFVYPETAHKTLEELGSVFSDQTEEEREILRRREDNIYSGERRPSEADSEKTLRGSIDNGQKKTEVPNAEQANEANTE